jgi:hypothetical protein
MAGERTICGLTPIGSAGRAAGLAGLETEACEWTGNAPALMRALMLASESLSGVFSDAGLPRSALTIPVSVAACRTKAATRSNPITPSHEAFVPYLEKT